MASSGGEEATAMDSLTQEEEPEDLFADYESPAEEAAEAAEEEKAPATAPDGRKFLDLEAAEDGEEEEDLEIELGKVIDEDLEAEMEKMIEEAGELDEVPSPAKTLSQKATPTEPSPAKATGEPSPSKEAATTAPSPAGVPTPQQSPQKEQPAPSPAKSEKISPEKDQFVDESRFMTDQNGVSLHKWKVDYAPRGGGGRAMCRDSDCLERHQQAGVRTIEKGEMRICRRILVEKDGQEGSVALMWYHARCIFNSFLRSRKETRVIESPEDIEGFDAIQPEDQELLRRIIAGNQDLKAAKFRTGDGSRAHTTPQQKRGPADLDTPMAKKPKKDIIELKKGDRCWTHCRVKPKPDPRAPDQAPAAFAVKSEKPELGLIVEEESDGTFIIQFESAEHEKARLDAFKNPKRRRIRPWLRYPRQFEGKKQRIPRNWVDWKRPPPSLCGCVKQSWAHQCDCGITCGRGIKKAVWGVGE